MYEYVSFLDAASLKESGSCTGNDVDKCKKRGRGRPRSNSYGTSSLEGSTDPSNGISESLGETEAGCKESLEEFNDASNGSGNSKQSDEDLKDQQEKVDTIRDAAAQHMDTNFSEELHGEALPNDDSVEHTTKIINTEPIKIVGEHPLMGLWEGSFKVKNVKGADDTIAETLFFYSTLDSDPPIEFKGLPPDPSFPFCLMKGSQWKAFLNSQLVKKEVSNNTNPVESIPTEEISSLQNTGSNEEKVYLFKSIC